MIPMTEAAEKPMVMSIHSGTSDTSPCVGAAFPIPVSLFCSVVNLHASTVVQSGLALVESVCATNPI